MRRSESTHFRIEELAGRQKGELAFRRKRQRHEPTRTVQQRSRHPNNDAKAGPMGTRLDEGGHTLVFDAPRYYPRCELVAEFLEGLPFDMAVEAQRQPGR